MPRRDLTTLTESEWRERGKSLFGDDMLTWRFVCPSCGHVATPKDWHAAGASDGQIAFSCIGRALGADGTNTFKDKGGPCDYAGGGLFRLNPVRVTFANGRHADYFDFEVKL